mmetsp:Transcript_17748/g.52208  ORF Transcript_17748/g.52208 Transcript_17748/m.52208 type:complete len:407 (+) Transcript_17748:1-1221(+)
MVKSAKTSAAYTVAQRELARRSVAAKEELEALAAAEARAAHSTGRGVSLPSAPAKPPSEAPVYRSVGVTDEAREVLGAAAKTAAASELTGGTELLQSMASGDASQSAAEATGREDAPKAEGAQPAAAATADGTARARRVVSRSSLDAPKPTQNHRPRASGNASAPTCGSCRALSARMDAMAAEIVALERSYATCHDALCREREARRKAAAHALSAVSDCATTSAAMLSTLGVKDVAATPAVTEADATATAPRRLGQAPPHNPDGGARVRAEVATHRATEKDGERAAPAPAALDHAEAVRRARVAEAELSEARLARRFIDLHVVAMAGRGRAAAAAAPHRGGEMARANEVLPTLALPDSALDDLRHCWALEAKRTALVDVRGSGGLASLERKAAALNASILAGMPRR